MARQIGDTCWGEAWLEALEARALADQNQLPRGRIHARKGLVRDLQLEPGRLAASVHGGEVHTTSLAVRVLSDAGWGALLERVMAKAKLAAALLAGEVPHELHDLLLPEAGDLSPDCTCSDGTELCKHAAALCHEGAAVFDADPFALLLLRGRARAQVLADLRRRRAEVLGVEGAAGTPSNQPRGIDPGVPAADAYRRRRVTTSGEPAASGGSAAGGLPPVPVPPRSRTLVRLAAPPPADSGINENELRELVADGARRAVAMLAGEADSGLGLSVGADVARRAIVGDVDAIATATNLSAVELAAAARAFHHGRTAGLAASRHRWVAPAHELASGIDALSGAIPAAKVVTRANTVSAGTIQLRLDEDGIWWRFEADDALGWLLAAPGSPDPTDLV